MKPALLALLLLLPGAAAALPTSLERNRSEGRLSLGVEQSADGKVAAAYGADFAAGLTDRLQLTLTRPGFAYRIGSRGAELLLWSGLAEVDFGTRYGVFEWNVRPGATVEARLGAVDASLLLGGAVETIASDGPWPAQHFEPVIGRFYAGWLLELSRRLEFNAGFAAGRRMETDEETGETSVLPGAHFGVGSVMRLGGRSVPLLRFAVTERFALDLYGSAWLDRKGVLREAETRAGLGWFF